MIAKANLNNGITMGYLDQMFGRFPTPMDEAWESLGGTNNCTDKRSALDHSSSRQDKSHGIKCKSAGRNRGGSKAEVKVSAYCRYRCVETKSRHQPQTCPHVGTLQMNLA